MATEVGPGPIPPSDRAWSRVAFGWPGAQPGPMARLTAMTTEDPRPRLVAQLKADQQEWRDLVADVGDRVAEPGPMGEWTFRDLAAHLMGWRERTLGRLEAAADGRPDPPDPWPPGLDDDDAINDWFQAQAAGRPAAEVLADIDASHDRLAAAVSRLPVEVLTDPERPALAGWRGGRRDRLGGPLPRGARTVRPRLVGGARLTHRLFGTFFDFVGLYRRTRHSASRPLPESDPPAGSRIRRRPARPRASAVRWSRGRRGQVPRP